MYRSTTFYRIGGDQRGRELGVGGARSGGVGRLGGVEGGTARNK